MHVERRRRTKVKRRNMPEDDDEWNDRSRKVRKAPLQCLVSFSTPMGFYAKSLCHQIKIKRGKKRFPFGNFFIVKTALAANSFQQIRVQSHLWPAGTCRTTLFPHYRCCSKSNPQPRHQSSPQADATSDGAGIGTVQYLCHIASP